MLALEETRANAVARRVIRFGARSSSGRVVFRAWACAFAKTLVVPKPKCVCVFVAPLVWNLRMKSTRSRSALSHTQSRSPPNAPHAMAL